MLTSVNKLQDDHGSAPLESKGNSRNIQGKHKGRGPERKQVCVCVWGGEQLKGKNMADRVYLVSLCSVRAFLTAVGTRLILRFCGQSCLWLMGW